jgi:hypothetical protein
VSASPESTCGQVDLLKCFCLTLVVFYVSFSDDTMFVNESVGLLKISRKHCILST